MATSDIFEHIRPKLEAAGQSHILQFENSLSQAEKDALLTQLQQIDLDNVNHLYNEVCLPVRRGEAPAGSQDISPFPSVTKLSKTAAEEKARWESIGLNLIADGKVAALLLSGGQGTRLGFDHPKGMYDIGLPSHKTLFQMFAERIRRLQAFAAEHTGKTDVVLPWYIMTSEINHKETYAFFKQHDFFGLDAKNLFFFEQGTLPCVTHDGKIIMETPAVISAAPNGNGGVYEALKHKGALADMRRRGVTCLHMFGVDNAIVKIADPVFVGYCYEKGADSGNKVVAKSGPEERVGVVCLKGGKPNVVEYSEMSAAESSRRDAAGELVFNAGNIANHYFTVDFLDTMLHEHLNSLLVQYHVADKKIKHVDSNGLMVTPAANNGYKLELFVFDIFPFSKNMAILEVDREEEFAPVKNAPGNPVDSPDSARQLVTKLHHKWIVAAGGRFSQALNLSDANHMVEISPLLSYSGENLSAVNGQEYSVPTLLKAPQEA